jgi:hypothetical protein
VSCDRFEFPSEILKVLDSGLLAEKQATEWKQCETNERG